MRVLAVTNLYPNPFDPIRATFNREQFRALATRHPVRVICPIAWTDELAARLRGRPGLPAGRRAEVDGLTVDYPRYWFPPKVLRARYGHRLRASLRGAFERALDEFRPDVVLAAWAYPDGWAAVELARAAGLPVAIKVHGCDVLWGLRQNPGRVERTKEALRRADLVVAVSRDLADNVARFGVPDHRIRVVYDGVETSAFRPGSKAAARAAVGMSDDAPNVLFVGSLVPVKGLDFLLPACARLAAAGRRFRLHLVGSGPLRATLERQARGAGLADRVVFHGSRPHADLPDWFRAADLFVLPSRSEGVPCVLLEAMACGTAFVASRVGGIPEVAAHGAGALVAPGDVGGLAEAIDRQLARGGTPSAGWDRSHADAAADLASCLGLACSAGPEAVPAAV
jgi:glycosyltransferase involved in cell wall biosynthesis